MCEGPPDYYGCTPPWEEPTQEQIDEYYEELEAGRARDEMPWAYGELPRMPDHMDDVHSQILHHPGYYNKLSEAARSTQAAAHKKSLDDRNTGAENKWTRSVWRFLYLDEAQPSDSVPPLPAK